MRSITLGYRKHLESILTDEIDLCFLTITHAKLAEPIRVVWDTKDFSYGGNTFIGFPFEITILSDDENPPSARLAIQNIDPRITDVLRGLGAPLRIKIELLSSEEFFTSPTTRYAAPIMFSENFESASLASLPAQNGSPVIVTNPVRNGYYALQVPANSWAGAGFAGTARNIQSVDFMATTMPSVGAIIMLHNMSAGGYQVYCSVLGDGKMRVHRSIDAGTDSAASYIEANKWYRIDFEVGGGSATDGFLRAYVDGVLAVEQTGLSIVGFPADFYCFNSTYGGTAGVHNFDNLIVRDTQGTTNVAYVADKLFLINITGDILTLGADIVGWNYLQRVWPGIRATQERFPGLFR